MSISEKSYNDILSSVKDALDHFIGGEPNSAITDIFFQLKQGSGELVIMNDDDKELAHVKVTEWVDTDDDGAAQSAETELRTMLTKMHEEKQFDSLTLVKPYSFVLVDEDKETLAELLLVDDDTLLLNDELLKGLDEELDAFLKDLLEK